MTTFKYLVLPLLITSGLSLLAHSYWKFDGFFINLSTELIGILFTIIYVDWVLRRHEQRQWASTDERIAQRLRILLNATISGLRNGLGFGTDILNQPIGLTLDTIAMHKDIIRIAEHVIAPEALSRVKGLDQNGWIKLSQQIRNAHNGTITFLNYFQSRLTPGQVADLLDLEEALANSLTFYSTFPDLMGIPQNKLPQTKSDPEALQNFGCETSAKEIKKICSIAKKLSHSIPSKAA